ncbi:MAG: fatty acid--CoA ligase family protein, partial [Gemmatimonadaceae bacterium]|nr:fatty acid--CoA ligase family protein [Gemmatimonadaceae bacterium]
GPGIVGWPLPFAELRLVDETGCDVPAGHTGELWLRGPQRFAGYLHDASRTAEAITSDGWFRSGDLMSRDPDGAYRVRGRRKEMYISGGENVYPAEVESVLLGHEDIAEVVVIGVPDDRWGEVGCAVVRLKGARTLVIGDLRAWARERLAAYKVPHHVRVVDALPRLGSGKVDRSAVAREVRPPMPG